MGSKENENAQLVGAIRDAFMDYSGIPNVVDGLMAIARAIDRLADVLEAPNHKKGDG